VLSLFLVVHGLLVEVDFHACYENYAMSVGGGRRYPMVGEMSLPELAHAAGQRFSTDDLIIAALGLLPLLPFLAAWLTSRSKQTRTFWLISGLASLVIIVAWICSQELSDYYDCDLNGVSLGILLQPILCTAINAAVVIALAALRPLAFELVGKE
jgi:hypothetical protein